MAASTDGGLLREYQRLKQRDEREPAEANGSIVGKPGVSPRRSAPVGPIMQQPHQQQSPSNSTEHQEQQQPTENDATQQQHTIDMPSVAVDATESKHRFVAITTLEDVQAIRAVAFQPSGRLYAVGSNSKVLRVCAFPETKNVKPLSVAPTPHVLLKKSKYHKGSIYCVAWNQSGDLIATGSNDKSVRLLRWDDNELDDDGNQLELTFHSGTVRDLKFALDVSDSAMLLSGGAGDCKIYLSDCQSGTPIRTFSGHGGHIYSLHAWPSGLFASGSQDKTSRLWDIRSSAATNVISAESAFAAVFVEANGRMLVSGHEDGSCMLYDIRGGRTVQTFKQHTSDVRSVNLFSNDFYMLSASYDQNILLTDLHGDLTKTLNNSIVATHHDKAIQVAWHPTELAFASTSADRTCTIWSLQPSV